MVKDKMHHRTQHKWQRQETGKDLKGAYDPTCGNNASIKTRTAGCSLMWMIIFIEQTQTCSQNDQRESFNYLKAD